MILAVYHLGSLQQSQRASVDAPQKSDGEREGERRALEQPFKTVADLAASKIVYPITLRGLPAILAEQQF